MPGASAACGDESGLTATAEDALTVDGRLFTGSVRFAAEYAPYPRARVAYGDRGRRAPRRLRAVRDFGPVAPARTAFGAPEATPYVPRGSAPRPVTGTSRAADPS
ncbi:hypothetical protein AB0K02_32850 [Streptomyces sp. NPDC049597]|uniref:hypothetical protein n=1 Tax=Streptomyces sp. NPDC049597 TaxID=3155276 RepID=UPI003413439E